MFGIARINTLSKYIADSASVNAVMTSLGIAAPASFINSYQQQLAYAGQDSSSRPVFVFSYADTSSVPSAAMFRINSDMTVTVGTPISVGSAACSTAVLCKTERSDVGLRTTSGYTDYVYFGWNSSNQIYASTASYALDTLTLTVGSQLSIHPVNSGGIFLAYMGSRRCAIGGQGGNNGNQYVTDLITRTSGSTTLTKSSLNFPVGYFGQAGGHFAVGAGTNRFVILSNTNNGHDGNYISVKYTGSTFVSQTLRPFYLPTTNTFGFRPFLGQLNNTGKAVFSGVGTYNSVYALRSQVIDNAWNPDGTGILPSSSEGAIVTESTYNTDQVVATTGSVDNEACLFHIDTSGSGYTLRYKKLTANQDTLTEGSWTAFDSAAQTGLPIQYASANGINVGSDYYLVAVGRDATNNVFRVAAQKMTTSSAVTQGSSVLRMEYVTRATSAASTITIPASAVGDFAILFDTSTSTTNTIPSGWTSVVGTTTTGIRSNISWKKLVSGDIGGSTTITGMGGTTSKVLMIFRSNTGTFTTASFSTPAAQATTAVPTAQTITVISQATPNLAFAHYTSTGAVATRTFSGFVWNDPVAAQEAVGGATRQYVKWYSLNKNNDDQNTNFTVSMSDSGTNALQSFRVSFS